MREFSATVDGVKVAFTLQLVRRHGDVGDSGASASSDAGAAALRVQLVYQAENTRGRDAIVDALAALAPKRSAAVRDSQLLGLLRRHDRLLHQPGVVSAIEDQVTIACGAQCSLELGCDTELPVVSLPARATVDFARCDCCSIAL